MKDTDIQYNKIMVGLFMMLTINYSHADISLGDIINNTKDIWRALYNVTMLAVYFFALLLALVGVSQLAQTHNEKVSAKTPILTFSAALLFYYLPALIVAINEQLYGGEANDLFGSEQGLLVSNSEVQNFLRNTTPNNKLAQFSENTLAVILTFVSLVGLWAVMRGIWLIYQMGKSGQSSREASWGKAITHIVGGFFAITLVQFSTSLRNELLG